MRYYIYSSTFMYKRAREVAEFYLVAYLFWFYGRCLATGQTSAMMQHEVAWLFRRQSKLARVQLGHTLDFQFAHWPGPVSKGWCVIYLPCKSKCQVTTHGIEDIQFSCIGRKTQSVRKTCFPRRIGGNIWIWTKPTRTLYCKLENSNVWNVIHSCKEGIHDGVICYREGGAMLTVAQVAKKFLFRVVMYFPTCCIKPSEKITLDSIWF